jgi:hypothetical protein
MKLTVTINLDNSAFGLTAEDAMIEARRILNSSLLRLEYGGSMLLRDSNGNSVGAAHIDEEK